MKPRTTDLSDRGLIQIRDDSGVPGGMGPDPRDPAPRLMSIDPAGMPCCWEGDSCVRHSSPHDNELNLEPVNLLLVYN